MNSCKIEIPSSKDELNVAYLILTHTDPHQLERLVGVLDNPEARIFIHLDAKVDEKDFFNKQLPSSAKFIEDRVKVSWGGVSIIDATLNLIKAALKSEVSFSHLVLLSGLDYPIKPIYKLQNLLTENPNKQFIRYVNMNKSPDFHLKRVTRFWFWEPICPWSNFIDDKIRRFLTRTSGLLYPAISRNYFKEIIPAFGSQWWAITSECASWILEFVESNPEFKAYYKHSHAPDEHFFHTVIANSSFSKQTKGFEDDFNIGVLTRISNLHAINLGKIYDDSDFPDICSSDKFFIRKVTSLRSKKLVELINRKLLLVCKT